MKLSDLMSGMGLATYAQIALLIFFAVFAGVGLYVWLGGSRLEALRFLPLDDGASPEPESTPKE